MRAYSRACLLASGRVCVNVCVFSMSNLHTLIQSPHHRNPQNSYFPGANARTVTTATPASTRTRAGPSRASTRGSASTTRTPTTPAPARQVTRAQTASTSTSPALSSPAPMAALVSTTPTTEARAAPARKVSLDSDVRSETPASTVMRATTMMTTTTTMMMVRTSHATVARANWSTGRWWRR